jgi:curved DNA-binding protein CbpA
MTDDELDVYRVLRIDPQAEDFVLEAAYRALARHFHPDGVTPDATRMAEINRAYDQVRTAERRKRYDRLHRIRPMGPGLEAPIAPTGELWAARMSAPATQRPERSEPGVATIDFGRYAGWTLKDLARHDPDYLRWLSRHSSGVRFRNQIMALLPPEPVAARR